MPEEESGGFGDLFLATLETLAGVYAADQRLDYQNSLLEQQLLLNTTPQSTNVNANVAPAGFQSGALAGVNNTHLYLLIGAAVLAVALVVR